MNNENLWEKAYELSIGNIDGYKKRLRDLLVWDKPDYPKDQSGKWTEWAKKCVALKSLIWEQYPNMKITLDNKIILGKSKK